MSHSIKKIRTQVGRIKDCPNPAGFNEAHHKTTPGSAGTNAGGVMRKKRASIFKRRGK